MSALCYLNRPTLVILAMSLALLPLRSTGAERSCDPALIDTVITNSPLCPGDHINLSVVASGDILGYSWQGPGTGEYFTYTPEFSFSFQILGAYVVVVYGECGNDTATVMINAAGAGAGHDDTLHLCDDGPPRDLAVELGTHAVGGTWTFDELPHSGIYDPAVDVPGDYVYTSPFAATCPGTSQTATITVDVTHVGPDTATSTCALDSAFGLTSFLSPDVTPGGTWSRYVFLSIEPHSGIYDPAIDSSGVFQYAVQGCSVSVLVIEDPALPWFQDADGDGLGDPLVVAWSCTQPMGSVADSTDNCAAMPGKIGDACDDGRPETVEDVITDSCTCAGVTITAILSPQTQEPFFSIWPNPNAGDRLYLQLPGAGTAEVQLFDALGKLQRSVRVRSVPDHTPMGMDLGGGLAKGLYLVRVTMDGRSSTAPLVIR